MSVNGFEIILIILIIDASALFGVVGGSLAIDCRTGLYNAVLS
jgi:hypothetical protein